MTLESKNRVQIGKKREEAAGRVSQSVRQEQPIRKANRPRHCADHAHSRRRGDRMARSTLASVAYFLNRELQRRVLVLTP